MLRHRTIAQVEADLVALRATAERAGMALACLFSSSDEFEAAVIRARRAQGALPPLAARRNWLRPIAWTILLTLVLVML